MEFLVELALDVPPGTPEHEVQRRTRAEATAAADLAARGVLVRLWTTGPQVFVGLYRAEDREHLDTLLAALPLAAWLRVTVTPLGAHPNDPATRGNTLPDPALTLVYRLDATLAAPLELGEIPPGQQRIIPLTGGEFTGPELRGVLVTGAGADWQTVLPDGTSHGEIRYTLRTDGGDLLDVRSWAIRHGSAEVLARLAAGDAVDPGEYVFRASTRIRTAAPGLEWLNKGVFVTVGARRPGGISYETYLVG